MSEELNKSVSSGMLEKKITRRDALKNIAVIAGGIAVTAMAGVGTANAGTVSKASVQYQDQPARQAALFGVCQLRSTT